MCIQNRHIHIYMHIHAAYVCAYCKCSSYAKTIGSPEATYLQRF